MRNPATSAAKIPKSLHFGNAIGELLHLASSHESVLSQVDHLLNGEAAKPLDSRLINHLRSSVLEVLGNDIEGLPIRSATARTPLQPEIFWAWGKATGDPDSVTLASWLQTGAPLGFSEPIPNTGIFPPVESMKWDLEAAKLLAREFEGWQNHPSANEFESDLNQLVRDALDKGFCSLSDSVEEATCKVGIEPTFNKLGVIVKGKTGCRKKTATISSGSSILRCRHCAAHASVSGSPVGSACHNE